MNKSLVVWMVIVGSVVRTALGASSNPQLQGWFNTSKTWGGTIQSSNSKYTEKDTVPLRFLANLTPGTHTLLLKYDFTDSGGQKHFFDSLGSYNATVAGVNLLAGTSFTGSGTTATIPTDTSLRSGAQIPGSLTVYGCTATINSTYTTNSGVKIMTVTLTVPGTGTTAVPILIGYGGHLSTENVWGVGNGASKWSGASGKAYASVDGSSDTNESINPGAIVPSADLALSITASPEPVGAGSNVTYTITVTNSGPDQATSVTVTNTLPSGVTFVSSTPTQVALSGNNVSFALGSINALASTNITLIGKLSVGQCAGLTDKAFVSSAILDPTPANNTNSIASTVSDKVAPTIACSSIAAQTANADANCSALVPDVRSMVRAQSSDNCTAQGALTVTQVPLQGSTVSGLGAHPITVTVSDAANNSATCVVAFSIKDTTAPSITACAPGQNATLDPSTCQAAVPSFTNTVTATDNCTASAALVITQTPAVGTLVGPGVTTITITVKDAAGNSGTCSSSFTVSDKTAPSIACNSVASQTANGDANCSATVPDVRSLVQVQSSDNCTARSSLTISQNPVQGTTVSGTGSHPITVTVADSAGNSATCIVPFTVTDKLAPIIACPSAPIIVDADPTNCGAVVNFSCPTATDNCGASITVTCTPPSGSFFPIGTNVVIASSSPDASGNSNQCPFLVVVKDSMNRAWPLARTLPLQGVAGALKTASFSQCLTALDQSRWYKFKVTPGSKVIVTLSNLKENYDLVLYKDIFEAYSNLLTETDAAKLSAQFAASAFSASAFSADAFSASAFSASAFSASAFSASAFSASAFSASAFSASAFSASAFSPDAFAASAFSPEEFSASAFSASAFSASAFSASAFSASAFSASAFSASAFSAAQMISVIGGSAFEGIANEGIIVNTWDQSGDFYVRVRGRNGVFSPGDAFDLNVYEYPSACEGLQTVPVDVNNNNTPLPASTFAAPGNGYKTLIITDLSRWTPGTDVMTQLQAFTNRTEVSGCLVDVSQDAWVNFFNQQADQMVDCPFAKNLVAEAIKNIIDRSRNGNSLEYIVILGGDNVIPFFRYPDEALLGPERNYVPPVKDQSSSQASIKYNLVPNQDFYGAKCDLSLKTMNLPLPDLAVGRLAETPSDVAGMLSAYNSTTAGVVSAGTSLVTGYDFLADSSMAVSNVFAQGIGSVDALISPNNLAPELCWTADDLRAKLFGVRHDIVYLAGHFSAGSALAADFDTTIFATELTNAATDFKNALIFSAGCHSGYNVVNGDELPVVSPDPDWVQAAARKQATLVAGSGYQYGDTDTIEYSERLYLEFAKQLRNAQPNAGVPVGKALIGAKMIYLAGTPQMRGIHTKAYLEATLYGLPMLSFNLPNKAQNAPAGSSGISPISYNSFPGTNYGLQYADFPINPSLLLKHVTMTNIDLGTSVLGTYYEGSSGIINNPAEPILPIEVRSVGVSGTTLRGVGFREGDYTDNAGLTPVTGAATTEIRGVHATFFTQTLYPMQFWNVNYFGALCGLGDGATRLVAIPAQFQSSSSDFSVGTMRTFSSMKFRLFYNNDMSIYGTGDTANVPGQSGPPAISAIQGITSPDGSHVDISAHVVGNPTSGIQEVWVTYTGTNGDFSGKWRSVNLAQDPIDSTLWKGTLTLTGGPSPTPSHNVRYMLSAVTGNGVVTVDTKLGAYHIPDEFDSANTANLPKTTVQLAAANPASGAYADTVTVKATLKDTNGVALANRLLVFSLGDQETFAFTDGSGVATAKIQIRTEPGLFDLKASFPGADQLAPSFDQKPFTITPQTISMLMNTNIIYAPPGGDTPLIASLHDGVGNYILERSVIFVMFDSNTNPVYAKAIITGINGRARLGKIPATLLDGTYKITAYFNGQIPLPGGNTITLEDPRYVDMTADALAVATSTIVVDGHGPSLSCTNYNVNTDLNQCAAYVTLDPGVASDPNLASVVFTPPSGTFNKGSTPVTCVATDKAGNQSTCQFNVVVSDAQKPSVTCPANVTTTTGSGNCVAVVNNIDATFSDNCPGVTVSYVLSGATIGSGSGQASGSTFSKGVTTVTYTATDASGNVASCNFTVTVNDTTAPVIVTCPTNRTIVVGTSCTATIPNLTSEVVAHDNCTPDGNLVITQSPAAGTPVALGSITPVVVTVKDTATPANQASCTVSITAIDTTAPTITCPTNITVNSADANGVVTFSVTATDNCGGALTATSVPPSGSTFPVGTTTVTSTATDAAGNKSTCTFTVTVKDTSSPIITGLTADPNLLSPPNHQQVLITLTINATDNSNGTLTTRITQVTSSDPTNTTGDGNTTGDWMFDSTQFITTYPGTLQLYVRSERAKSGPGRTYTIYVTTTDSAGNSATATTTVFVK